MVDLKPLDMIPHLTHLDISGNLLKDLHRIIEILARIPSLQVGLSHKFVYFTFFSIVTTWDLIMCSTCEKQWVKNWE